VRTLFALSEDTRLADFVGQLHDQPLAQGVILDHDPLWLALAELRALGLSEGQLERALVPQLRDDDVVLADLRRSGIAPLALLPARWQDALERRDQIGPLEHDLDWRPSIWREYSERSGRPTDDPRRVLVSLRPTAPSARIEFAASLIRSANELSLDVVAEVRPIAQLASAEPWMLVGGQPIYLSSPGGPTRGTMGGLLLNRATGLSYGVTCGHVARMGDDIFGREALVQQSHLGRCVVSLTPPGPVFGGCNPFRNPAIYGNTDIALIELDSSVQTTSSVRRIGPITRITAPSDVSQNQSAQISAASGRRDVRLGGLASYYQFSDSEGRPFCYHHLLEIKPRSGWFAAPLPGFSRMPVGGDSGGWICTSGRDGPEALAILVATEQSAAFAGYLEFALGNLAQAGFDLTVA